MNRTGATHEDLPPAGFRRPIRFGLVSLGCDKNTVDSERICGTLLASGGERVVDLREADLVLVNTCAFIDAAKKESIETLLRVASLKEEGACRAVVGIGCLVERYRDELARELPEVDLWIGLKDLGRLVPELRRRRLLDGSGSPEHPGERVPLGAGPHVRYLKVSEGCDHGCAFCAIPLWRGRHRSFAPGALVAEAQRLEAQGAVEVCLVAQDLAHYGRDLRDGTEIATLLRTFLAETSIPWFRLLYIYSAGLRPPLAELMAAEPRILPYIDMPIQHAADTVLERMRRPERQAALRRKVAWLREAVPDLTLRTTVMVGFPGETDEEFRTLIEFLEEMRFERLGAFAFSPQPGTRAEDLPDAPVPPELARERLEELIEVQRGISAACLAEEIGRTRTAIVDRPGVPEEVDVPEAAATGAPRAVAVGRTAAQADDVDGVCVLYGDRPLRAGQIVEVEVTAAGDYDLSGAVRRIVREAPDRGIGSAGPRGRRLPIARLGLETAWGR